MKDTTFGVEIEFSGMTRSVAAETVKTALGGTVTSHRTENYLDTYRITAPDGREWKICSDSSVHAQDRNGRDAGDEYKCELVSPPLLYDNDIEQLQNLVRTLRKNGGRVSESEGMHIHLDGARHDLRTLKNFLGLMYARNELFFDALQVPANRHDRWCAQFCESFVEKFRKCQTLDAAENTWYSELSNGYRNRTSHYNDSRYHALNLHSFFNGSYHTVELRLFNSTLHAGKIRANILFALALNHQALKARSVSTKKPQTENPKYAMRTYLLRLSFIGDEFKNPREHLCSALEGNAAWR